LEKHKENTHPKVSKLREQGNEGEEPMKGIAKLACGIAAAVIFTAAQASAQTTIVYYAWNNTGVLPDTNAFVTADTGSSISTFSSFSLGVLSFPAGTTLNAQPGFVAGNSVSRNGWDTGAGETNYFQITLNATGWQNIIVSYALARSNTGPRTNEFWYSTDGGSTFTLFATYANVLSNNTYMVFTNNLTGVTALNNNPNVVFRIIGKNVATGTTGTMRIDNFTIDATLIPEPSTLTLVGLGVLGALVLRRRRL
jgi:hypothetical protein